MKAFICITFLCAIALTNATPLVLGSSDSSSTSHQAGLNLAGLVQLGAGTTQQNANAHTLVTNGNPVAPVGSETAAAASSTNHNINAGILGIPIIGLNSGTSNTQTQTVVRQ